MTKLIKAPKILIVGKSYKLKTPTTHSLTLVYIDNIMKNPVDEPIDGYIDNAEDLYTYRVWTNRGWKWDVTSFWKLCLINNWNYKK